MFYCDSKGFLLPILCKSLFLLVFLISSCYGNNRPNIIIIMADDMGIDDVSFRGSNQILTPNIDSLAYHGVILDRYYVPAICTPSRASLLTGKYPIHTGMQHFVIPNDEPWGLPLNFTIMPEIFRSAGYSTNLIGKWNLGFFNEHYTPLYRGFDYHFGYYGGYIDYYDHTLLMMERNYSRGLDMRRNLNVAYDVNGKYATDLFNDEAVQVIKNHDDQSKPLFMLVTHLAPHAGEENDPVQAPNETIENFSYISDSKRRTYAAMVSKLDEGVGKIIEALNEKSMLENSVIIFYSDNGAPTIGHLRNFGSNYPLRGQKYSPWEGGIRTPSIIWSSLIKNRQRISYQTFHAIDWLPTLAAAANIDLNPNLKLDGENLWDQISNKDYPIKSREIVHNIDEIVGYSVYMNEPWKYINGTTCYGECNEWLGRLTADNNDSPRNFDDINYGQMILKSNVTKILRTLTSKSLTIEKILSLRQKATIECSDNEFPNDQEYKCEPEKFPCLFNILNDPCEEYNLASTLPQLLEILKTKVENIQKTSMPSVRKPPDYKCDPVFHNYTWTWWR